MPDAWSYLRENGVNPESETAGIATLCRKGTANGKTTSRTVFTLFSGDGGDADEELRQCPGTGQRTQCASDGAVSVAGSVGVAGSGRMADRGARESPLERVPLLQRPIKSCPAHARQLTHPPDTQFALRHFSPSLTMLMTDMSTEFCIPALCIGLQSATGNRSQFVDFRKSTSIRAHFSPADFRS